MNIDNRIAFPRFARRQTQQRIRLAQTEEGMRFLAPDWRKNPTLKFSADVMRAITVIA